MFAFDFDIFSFLWTTAVVAFGSKGNLRKNSKPVPLRYTREILGDSALTEAQGKYIAPVDAQLLALGFRPLYTLRVTNYGSNLVRGYINPADPASCTLTIVEVRTNTNGVQNFRTSQVVNFTTRFSGGKELVTRNMELRSLMDPPDYKIIQDCPYVTDLAALKQRHDARASSLSAPLSPPHDIPGVIAEFDREHEIFCDHQLRNGIFALNSDKTAYLLTNKVFNRGIRNFFNPFARRISPTKLVFSALVGAVLPLYGVLRLAPMAADHYGYTPAFLLSAPSLAILACYMLAGAIVGLFAGSQSYLWVMLITYVPAHLIAGWSFGTFPYSTAAFLACFFVARFQRKRQLVLQS
jgi:hypothetical protein